MESKAAEPKDASAIILLNESGEVFLAQRNPSLAFMGGFHAFPGGKVDAGDAEIVITNSFDSELDKFIACAVREVFEEIGVLLVRGGERLTKGQRASLHDDLTSGRSSFGEILSDWDLWIDAEDFSYSGFWTTPSFSPVRFKTRFFIAHCPPRQSPQTYGELVSGVFTTPKNALDIWSSSELLIAPPVLISLQSLHQNNGSHFNAHADILRERAYQADGDIHYIRLNSRITVFPLRTKTLPPATHTNCFVVGHKGFVVIDAASPDKNEQAKLHALIDEMITNGSVCKEIIISHLHPDHFGGETALQKHLREKYGVDVPISGHALTQESLAGKVEFQKLIEDNDIFELKDENGDSFEISALHTPGHARGHLCFYDQEFGFLVSCDNVISLGSVVIAPPEGNMIDYLASLKRMKSLPNLKFLCGSHGMAIYDAVGKIDGYIAHRMKREKQVLEAYENGLCTPPEIVEKIYVGLKPELIRLAEKSVEAHLEKLEADGLLSS